MMKEKKQLNQKELEKVTGGANYVTDYYCSCCGKVTSPKTKTYTEGKRDCYKQVCSVCDGEYNWIRVYD